MSIIKTDKNTLSKKSVKVVKGTNKTMIVILPSKEPNTIFLIEVLLLRTILVVSKSIKSKNNVSKTCLTWPSLNFFSLPHASSLLPAIEKELHGGEPSSVEFCHKVGLNYVSCSPFRVPIARLAAAQAALKNK